MLIPPSVRAYVRDDATRRAVREILAMPSDAVLEGLRWDELPRFYRAQLAARQLAAEWGAFGCEAWHAVWEGLLNHWRPLTPDEQIHGGYEAGLDLVSLLDTHDDSLWFGRLFANGAYTFYACLAAVPGAGMRIRVSCGTAGREIGFEDLAPFADEVGNWSPLASTPLEEQFDGSSLKSLAVEAVRIADAGSSARKKEPKGSDGDATGIVPSQ